MRTLARLGRRSLLGTAAALGLSLLTYWFFATNFYGPSQGQGILPLWWSWVKGLPSGGLQQTSLGTPVQAVGTGVPGLVPALGHTAVLLGATFLLVLVFGLLIGVAAATSLGRWPDVVLRGLSYAAWSVPAFLLALVLQTLLSSTSGSYPGHPLPLVGWAGYCPPASASDFYNGPCPSGSGLGYAANVVRHVTLPALALAASFVGLHARYLRSSLMSALSEPYILTARAKGLPERVVLVRHALRNSLVSFVNALMLDFGSIFSAALAVDAVFKIGGLGSLFIAEIASPTIDPNEVTSLLFATALLALAASLAADVVTGWLDPRMGSK